MWVKLWKNALTRSVEEFFQKFLDPDSEARTFSLKFLKSSGCGPHSRWRSGVSERSCLEYLKAYVVQHCSFTGTTLCTWRTSLTVQDSQSTTQQIFDRTTVRCCSSVKHSLRFHPDSRQWHSVETAPKTARPNYHNRSTWLKRYCICIC